MSDKYSENIQQIAKEMAEAYGNHIVPSGLITAACVAIRWAMPAARAAYMRGASDKAKGLHCDSVDCGLYMQSAGLIPDSAQPFESSNFAKFMKGYYGDSAQEGGKDETI